MTMGIEFWLTKKVAKRKLKCRDCGAVIPKGGEYWVVKYREGPYVRRRVLCRGCAIKVAEMDVRNWMGIAFERNMCVERSAYDNMKVIDALAHALVFGAQRWYECVRDPGWLARMARKAYTEVFRDDMWELVDFEKVAGEFLESIDKEGSFGGLPVKWVKTLEGW